VAVEVLHRSASSTPVILEARAAPSVSSSGTEWDREHSLIREAEYIEPSLNAIPDPVLILNSDRRIVFANQAAHSYFGAAEEGLHGLRAGDFLRCEVADSAPTGCGSGEPCRACGGFLATMAAMEGRTATEECRISRCRAQQRDSLDLRVHCRPFRVGGERFVTYVLTDISAQKRRDVLERIFLHDILNLAGGVAGMTSLLAEDQIPLESVIQELHSTSEEIVQEIHSQRLLLAAENGSLAVTPRHLDTVEILERVRRTYRLHPIARGRQIQIEPDAARLEFVSDDTILLRVLGNILKNALEASVNGDLVRLTSRRTEAGVEFSCHNPAVMPEHVRLQMFRRSFSTKGHGRGIGTYSVRLLTTHYLGGSVSFTSRPGSGTEFTVILPIRSGEGNPRTEPESPAVAT
jgi:nitrogen-specific signal transduction histidine kinase